MNRHDKEILALNWELKKNQQPGGGYQVTMDVSSGCYVTFGTYGVAVCKHRNGGWCRKVVNDWKSLSFDEFMEKFEQEEWEVL